jgi:hypothetical protein
MRALTVLPGKARLGTVRLGTVRLGTVRLGMVLFGMVRLGTVLLFGTVLLAGCTSEPPSRAGAPPPALPQFTTSAEPPPARTERAVPNTCGQVITPLDLDDLLETRISGATSEVVGTPVPAIGRTARIDCYFGIPGRDRDKAALVVTLAAYSTPEAAGERVERTLADERARGARITDVEVGPDRGALIEGAGRIVVARHGRITVVVRASIGAVPGDQAARVLPEIADRALA